MSVNKNIYYTFLTQGPTLFLGLFINFFITKILMAEGKGVYSIFQSDIDLLALFLGFTISSAIVFYISNSKIALEKLIGIGISVIGIGIILLSIILVILNLAFSNNVLFPKGYSSLYHYVYLIIAFGLVISISIISSIFQGKSLFRVVNFLTVFNSSINFLVFGTLFYLSIFKGVAISINQVLVISIIIYILNLITWLYFYKKYINIRPKFNFEYTTEIKPLFIFMTIGHIAHMVNFLTYKMDYWIVEHYNGAKELGYYSQAVGFAQMFWAITNPIIIVLTPYLTSKESKDSIESFKFYSRINFTIIFTLVIIAALLAGIIFPIYGSEFTNSVLPFRILSIGIIMSCITKVFAVYIYAQNKIIYNLKASIIAFIVTLTLDFVLIPTYGSIGASIATAISYTSLTIAVSYFLFVKLKVDFKNMFILTRADIVTIKSRIPIAIFKK